ncbi:MAG: PKD domain-containing protein, partial [Bacteroidota bacterium]
RTGLPSKAHLSLQQTTMLAQGSTSTFRTKPINNHAENSCLIFCRVLCASTIYRQYQIDTKLEISQKYVSQINTDFGSILFSYNSGRLDLSGGKRLSFLKVFDDSNNEVKRVDLDHTYINKSKRHSDPTQAIIPCNSDFDCNRLLLKTISENDIVTSEFDYIGESDFNFPRRYDPYLDHWGFFNFSQAYGHYGHNGYRSAIPDIFGEGARKGSHTSGRTLSLEKIKNHAGGYQRFEYNEHSSNVGGPRLEKIWLSADGTSEWQENHYTYANPYSLAYPVYDYEPQFVDDLVIKSTAYNELFDLNGVAIGYGTVTNTYADNSKTISKYSNSERPDVDPVNSVALLDGFNLASSSTSQQGASGPPFTSRTSKFWERGILKESQLIDDDGDLVKKIVNTPDYTYPVVKTISNWTLQTIYDNWNSHLADPVRFFYVGQYEIISKYINASETTVYDYDQDNDNDELSERIEYFYHPSRPSLVQSMIQHHADGSETKLKYKYPFDYSGASVGSPDTRVQAIAALINQNVLTIPLETIRYFRSRNTDPFKVVSGQLNTFKFYSYSGHTKPLPYQTFELRLATSVESIIESYIIPGVTFIQDAKYKLTKTYTFDASTENLVRVEDESGLVQNYGYNSSDYLTSSTLNPSGNSLTTTYTHKKLVGVTKITDANNNDQAFEYNPQNRLKLVRDRDGYITERYRYNYHNIQEFNADFSITNAIQTGSPVTFKVTSNPPPIGKNKYMWDFGDGTVLENGPTQINHTYSSPATYSVRLIAQNAEYEPLEVAKEISIIACTVSKPYVCGPFMYNPCLDSESGTCVGSSSDGLIEFEAIVTSNVSLTYQWEFRYFFSTWSGWISFGNNNNRAGLTEFNFVGSNGQVPNNLEVKCTVTDICGNVIESNTKGVIINYNGSCN